MKKAHTNNQIENNLQRAGSFPTRILSLKKNNEQFDNHNHCYYVIENSKYLYYRSPDGVDHIIKKIKDGLIEMEEMINSNGKNNKLFLSEIVESDLLLNTDNEKGEIDILKLMEINKKKIYKDIQDFFLIKRSDNVQLCIKTGPTTYKAIDEKFSSDIRQINVNGNEIVKISNQDVKDFFLNNNIIKKHPKSAKKIIAYPHQEENSTITNTEEFVTTDIKNQDKKNEDNTDNDNTKLNDCDKIIDDLFYWKDSKIMKFRYAQNWLGINTWRETKSIWGLTRRVREFFNEKNTIEYQNNEYKQKWKGDFDNMKKQLDKVNWIRNNLGDIVAKNCSYAFDRKKSWIDQLSTTEQKQKVVDYIKKDLKMNVDPNDAITTWSNEKNISNLIIEINNCKSEDKKTGENEVEKPSFLAKIKNKIIGWFTKK